MEGRLNSFGSLVIQRLKENKKIVDELAIGKSITTFWCPELFWQSILVRSGVNLERFWSRRKKRKYRLREGNNLDNKNCMFDLVEKHFKSSGGVDNWAYFCEWPSPFMVRPWIIIWLSALKILKIALIPPNFSAILEEFFCWFLIFGIRAIEDLG